ncbi:hypothetical protein YUWDRAFT_04543 [Streptomyces sp. AmelKG-D3]|nr:MULTISPECIES: hypothetical protein [unclassified Streptomyces]SCK51627.1 hypothetical protein YUWDRAFT_04543 [Streptomyces sp. AmelKG-D3]
MNLRMIGLTAAVAFACLIPIVASADPGGAPDAGSADGQSPDSSSEMRVEKLSDDVYTDSGAAVELRPSASPSPSASPVGDAARCGPELVAPEGVEAQTCVMIGGGETWARAYYRNTSGAELRSVVTLMGPAGRTVELHCALPAHDEPGSCETPRSPSAGGPDGYAAVAEYAGAGPVEEAPLLLRAGSDRAPTPEASGRPEASG